MSRPFNALAIVCVLLGACNAVASDLDGKLEEQLRGAWVVLSVEIYSSCSGTYSDNTIGPAGVSSKAGRRFAAGELVKIDKVKVKRSRVDLLATLAEGVLVGRQEGPFELFDEHQCKVQLIFEFPRSVIKGGEVDTVRSAIAAALTAFPSQTEARESAKWSGREREPLPAEYDLTLAHYERWQAEQTNAAVATSIEEASSEAIEVAEDIERDADYLDGFAAGAEEMQSVDLDDCAELIDASFSALKERPPAGESAKWKRGFEDGQSLVFHLYLLDELRRCYVPVPEAPPR